EEVILQTSNLFYQAASLEAQRKVIESNLEQTNRNLDITSNRFQNGLARKLDVDRLKVNAANLQTQLRTIDDSYSNVLNQLKLSMGMDVNAPLQIEEPIIANSSDYEPGLLTTNDWSFENRI